VILLIDNYDSFTYNLVDLIQRREPVVVHRNDAVTAEVVETLRPRGIVISPGPGRPQDSGVSQDIVARYHQRLPILGVCLGHQLIGELLGAEVTHAARPMHGKTSQIVHLGTGVFANLPQPLRVMRYHSLVLRPESLPNRLIVSAWTDSGEVMGIQHADFPLVGVQFHPESIGSEAGGQLLTNWLESICT
jgi:anthranilate synthase component 2